jgi:hypothetical protein
MKAEMESLTKDEKEILEKKQKQKYRMIVIHHSQEKN